MSNFIRVVQRNVDPPQKILINTDDISRIVFYEEEGAQKADFITRASVHSVKSDFYETTVTVNIPDNKVKEFVEKLKTAGINVNIIE